MSKVCAGHLAIIGTNLIFGLNMPVIQSLLSGWMTPMRYMLSRILFAALLFWSIVPFRRGEKVAGKDLLIIALGGDRLHCLSISLCSGTSIYYPGPKFLDYRDESSACHAAFCVAFKRSHYASKNSGSVFRSRWNRSAAHEFRTVRSGGQ